ncbi:MAG: hypothetical protein AB7T58_11650, partial [Hyphomonadaceae bacterium]
MALCAGASALAQTAPATYYSIVADSGATLGHVVLEVAPRPDGRDIIETQQILLREHSGMPHRARTRAVLREDASGRAVSIESTARAGRFWTRTHASFGADRIEIERETPNG